jgi:hypothetical protein
MVRERILEKYPGHARDSSLWIDIADNVVRWPLELVTGIAFVILALSLIAAFFPRRPLPGWATTSLVVSAVLVLIALTMLGARMRLHDALPPAVVLKTGRALAGPDERFKTVSDLVAGDEVRLTRATPTPGFVAIELNNGLSAWVLDGQVAAVEDWKQQ